MIRVIITAPGLQTALARAAHRDLEYLDLTHFSDQKHL
jgi:hypothetical protein